MEALAVDRHRIRAIFHPSDFSEASEIAFVHALKIALVTGASLDLLHVEGRESVDWSDFPGVRAALARWKLIPENSPESAIGALGIEVTKVIQPGKCPVDASLAYLRTHPTDLIVLAVHQYEGRTRWLTERVGQPIAQRAGEMTLFVPHGVKGFVSWKDGTVRLRNILVPVARRPDPQPAIATASRLVQGLGLPPGTLHQLHVGTLADAPWMHVPGIPHWNARHLVAQGDPAEAILQTAESIPADLIIMTTDGRQGFLDALRGSTSERVLRGATCPVVTCPAP